jgi:hypothetical protein
MEPKAIVGIASESLKNDTPPASDGNPLAADARRFSIATAYYNALGTVWLWESGPRWKKKEIGGPKVALVPHLPCRQCEKRPEWSGG